jgi:hypothetical protein
MFRFHYVTAREMHDLVRADETGWQGTVATAREYELIENCAGPLNFGTHADRTEEMRTAVPESLGLRRNLISAYTKLVSVADAAGENRSC